MKNMFQQLKEKLNNLKSFFIKEEKLEDKKTEKKGLGNYLIEKGIITEEQLQKALQYQSENSNKKIGEILAEMNILGEKEVLKELANYLGVQYVILEDIKCPISHQKLFKKKMMLDLCFAPFDLSGNIISIAISDINNVEIIKKIEHILRSSSIQFHAAYYLSLPDMIRDFIHRSYAEHPYHPNLGTRNKRFGEYLVEKNIVTQEQIDLVLEYQKKYLHKRIGELLYEMKILNKESTLKELAAYENKEYIMIDEKEIPGEVIKLFDMNFMIENVFIPFEIEDKIVKIAINNIFDDELMEIIESKLNEVGLKPRYYLALKDSILFQLGKAMTRS